MYIEEEKGCGGRGQEGFGCGGRPNEKGYGGGGRSDVEGGRMRRGMEGGVEVMWREGEEV